MAIYKTYFDVPDGAICRPRFMDAVFYQKKFWKNRTHLDYRKGDIISDVLGEWETEDRKVTITESEFSKLIEEALTDKDAYVNFLSCMLFIQRKLFK